MPVLPILQDKRRQRGGRHQELVPSPYQVILDDCTAQYLQDHSLYLTIAYRKLVDGTRVPKYPRLYIGKHHPQADKAGFILLHQLVWLLHNRPLPQYPLTLDHINLDRFDARFENLQISNPTHQNSKQSLRHNNKSGFKGVAKDKALFIASSSYRHRKYRLGSFKSPLDAAQAVNRFFRIFYPTSPTPNPTVEDFQPG